MPQAGLILNKIGSMRPTLGKFRFASNGNVIGLTNYQRFVRVGAPAGKDQGSYLDLRVDKEHILKACANPDWGLLLERSFLPKTLSDQVASCGKNFAAAFDEHCRWLLFLPKIEAQGEPVAGFVLSMAETTAGEVKTFLDRIDPSVGGMLRQDIDRTFFLNPHYIEKYPMPEALWTSTLVHLSNQVRIKYSREATGG